MTASLQNRLLGSSFKFILLIMLLAGGQRSVGQLSWVQVPSPDTSATRNMPRGISGTSSSDIWAVGSFEEVYAAPPYYIQKDLVMHWNGSVWELTSPVNLSTTLDDLFDVEAVASDDVWAVGDYNDPSTRAKLLHYDGSSWSNYNLPVITGGSYLYGLDAVSANDIWAVGAQFGSPTRLAYALHYNGSAWTEVPVPPVGGFRNVFNSVHGISAGDVWAVGHHGENIGDFHALAMHWDGNSWVNSPLPVNVTAQLGEILNITMLTSNDVWAVGYYLTGGMFKLHWDGSTWSDIANPNGGGGAFVPISSNDVYSVGGEISHWDGSNWTIIDSLMQLSYPSLVNTVTFANGEAWACGRTVDNADNFHSLVYRTVASSPVFAGGSSQNLPALPGVATSLDTLLKVLDGNVSQQLRYSVISSPAHGILTGLPDTVIIANGFAQPSGITYTADNGYLGQDQFTLRASVGNVFAETTVHVSVSGVLPVSNLIDFFLRRQGKDILVSWATAAELNTDHFEVERSLDGMHYQTISVLTAAGNSNSRLQYSFVDKAPQPGLYYYRLKLVERNGGNNYYPVKTIGMDGLHQLTVFPNPVKNQQLVFSLADNVESYQLFLYDWQGQIIFRKRLNNTVPENRIALPAALATGMYMVKIVTTSGTYTEQVLVK